MAVFQQSGQLDYVAMSNGVISNTLFMAQRLAAAGISDITHQAGLAMSTHFRLGHMGQMRIQEAVDNLRPYYGFERTLWFGFGHKSFLALLTEHQAGFNCAALCASLAAIYGDNRSAQLLQALWQVQGMSELLEPSRAQFRALVNGCSGLLVATPFPDVVRRMAGPCAGDIYTYPETTRSKDWAKAVNGIFQVSKGSLKGIKIHGRHDLSFLGAIAHWLFDLQIWVEMSDGTVIFASCRQPEEAEVCLYYADVEESDALIEISSTTFVLRSLRDLITDDIESPMNVRVPWNRCLTELYGKEMDRILINIALFGVVLGGIARIYEALRGGEVNVGGLSRTHFVNFRPAGYGRGFVDSICDLFPDLGTSDIFRKTALELLYADVPSCTERICQSIKTLSAKCGCSSCGSEGDPANQHRSCHVVILFSVRTVASTIAYTDIKQPIDPTRSGLSQIYSNWLRAWKFRASRTFPRLLELASGLPHADLASQGKERHSKAFLLDSILEPVAEIFLGSSYQDEFGLGRRDRDQAQCTAIAKNGVCLWIDALQKLSVDATSIATIHIAPGQIVYKEWNYVSIWDLFHTSKELLSSFTAVKFGETPTFTFQEKPVQAHNGLHILAQERAESGTIRLVYGLNEVNFERTLQPGIITEEVLIATAQVPCPRAATCSDMPVIPCWQRVCGWDIKEMPGQYSPSHSGEHQVAGFMWNSFSPIDRLLAIEGSRHLVWLRHGPFDCARILIRSDQCMGCMTRYITTYQDQASWEYRLYYRGKQVSFPPNGKDLICSFHII